MYVQGVCVPEVPLCQTRSLLKVTAVARRAQGSSFINQQYQSCQMLHVGLVSRLPGSCSYRGKATLALSDHKGAVCVFSSPQVFVRSFLFLGDVFMVFTSVERDCSVTPARQTNCALVLAEYLSSHAKNRVSCC